MALKLKYLRGVGIRCSSNADHFITEFKSNVDVLKEIESKCEDSIRYKKCGREFRKRISISGEN